jgi:hypothetical protein
MTSEKNLLSNEMISTTFNSHKVLPFLFYNSADMCVSFGERGKSEVLSVWRNKRLH